MEFTKGKLDHVCRRLLGLCDWMPCIERGDLDGILTVLTRCDSLLEATYLFGAVHRLELNGRNTVNPRVPILPAVTQLAGRQHQALWLLSPWDGFQCDFCDCNGGPSGILFVPQLSLMGHAWDAGIIFTDNNGSSDGDLFGVAEFDGYTVHRNRRQNDVPARRAAARHGVPVFSCYEELHAPELWFDAVIHQYWRSLWREPHLCERANACDVYPPTNSEAA